MNTKKTELEGGNKTEKEEIDTARTLVQYTEEEEYEKRELQISSIEGENLISYREGKKTLLDSWEPPISGRRHSLRPNTNILKLR